MRMSMSRSLAARFAAALVALALVAPGAAGAASGPTVSDFAVKVYRGSLSRQEAMAALRVLVPAIQGPDARLTEGSLAEIMNAYGIKSTTSQPGLLVDQGRADAALLFVWQSVSARGGNAGASSGAGGGSIDLSTCTPDRNIWTCMQCCIEQGGPTGSCSYFCTFGVSPSGP
jgi:hypothetical protein